MIRSLTWTTTSSTTVPFGVIAGVTGSVSCGCGAFGALNGLWYRGACACTTPGSASRPSPHTTANCEILKVIITRILGQTSASTYAISWSNIRINIRDSTSIAWDFRPVHWTHPGIGRYPYPILTALDRTSESPFRSGPGSPPDVILRQIGNVCLCAPLRDDLPFEVI